MTALLFLFHSPRFALTAIGQRDMHRQLVFPLHERAFNRLKGRLLAFRIAHAQNLRARRTY